MNIVHLWIGNTNKSDEEYQEYFQLDYSTEGDFDDPDYKTCGFCKDIGINWYDEDFIGILPINEVPLELNDLLKETIIAKQDWDKVNIICNSLGIEKANATFWYANSELLVSTPYKNSYNGLRYIGTFKGL